jgi:hypothetical protein
MSSFEAPWRGDAHARAGLMGWCTHSRATVSSTSRSVSSSRATTKSTLSSTRSSTNGPSRPQTCAALAASAALFGASASADVCTVRCHGCATPCVGHPHRVVAKTLHCASGYMWSQLWLDGQGRTTRAHRFQS